MNIGFVFGKKNHTLSAIGGVSGADKINEGALSVAMLKFAKVYFYDHVRKGFYGTNGTTKIDEEDIDFLYSRAGPKEQFLSFKKTKAWVARPYDEECFRGADSVITFTDTWNRLLGNKVDGCLPSEYSGFDSCYKGSIARPKKITTFHQVCGQHFCNKEDDKRTKKYRELFSGTGCDLVIGVFGKVTLLSYPFSMIRVIQKINNSGSGIIVRLVCCDSTDFKYLNKQITNRSKTISREMLNLVRPFRDFHCVSNRIPYQDMPHVYSACDATLVSSRTVRAEWGGSRKVVESMSCGVPVLCASFDVRREQLGDDYPLFWDWERNDGYFSSDIENQIEEKILSLLDKKVVSGVRYRLSERAKFYSIKAAADRLYHDIDGLISD